MRFWLGKIRPAETPTDLATKIMAKEQKQQYLDNKLLYNIFDHHATKKSVNFPARHKKMSREMQYWEFPGQGAK